MTHIVYNGHTLFADRKCYGTNGAINQQNKIRTVVHGNELWVWAFAGDYAECEYGDKVLMSNLDKDVIKEAKDSLGIDNINAFSGILVVENILTNERKAYLANYFGLRMEVATDDLVCTGAMAGDIQRTYKLLTTVSANTGISVPCLCGLDPYDPRSFYHTGYEIEWIIRHTTKNSLMGQDGYAIDRYDFKGGNNGS